MSDLSPPACDYCLLGHHEHCASPCDCGCADLLWCCSRSRADGHAPWCLPAGTWFAVEAGVVDAHGIPVRLVELPGGDPC